MREAVVLIQKHVLPALGGTHRVMISSEAELRHAYARRARIMSPRALARLREAGVIDAEGRLTSDGVMLLKAVAHEARCAASVLRRCLTRRR